MTAMKMRGNALTAKARAHIRREEAEDVPEADLKAVRDRDLRENIARTDTDIALEAQIIRESLPLLIDDESKG